MGGSSVCVSCVCVRGPEEQGVLWDKGVALGPDMFVGQLERARGSTNRSRPCMPWNPDVALR